MSGNVLLWVVVGVVVLGLVLSPLLGGLGMMGWGMMGPFGGGGLGFLPMLLLWGLIIAGIVFLARGLGRGNSSDTAPPRQDAALEILKQRYARGEISKEEFEAMKRDLA